MRVVVLFALEGAALLDVTGPVEAFSMARAGDAEAAAYDVVVASIDGGLLRTSCGVELMTVAARNLASRDIDTLLIAGAHKVASEERVLNWLAGMRGRIRRIGAISRGVLLLAAAGILDHRRATIHWASRDALRAFHKVQVESDALYVEDGGVWTSAGVSAGIDMALQMVEQDCGLQPALETARSLLLYLKRAGGQPQVSTVLQAQAASDSALGRLAAWILENPGEDLTTSALAKRAHVGLRSLFRVFREELGTTPRDFVENARLEAARRFLEQTNHQIDQVAFRSGFTTAEAMRRAFKRRLGMPPAAYRDRFTQAGPVPKLATVAESPLRARA
jgi:transcriptional regulator GlxA family with amidase domain